MRWASLGEGTELSAWQSSVNEACDWLSGQFPSLRVSFGLPDRDMMAAADLGDARSAAFAALLSHQRQLIPGADPRTEAAAALGQYSYFLALAAAAPYLRHGQIVDASPANLAFRLEQTEAGEGSPWRRFHMRLRALDSRPHREVRHDLLRTMLEDHLRPLIMALRERTRFGRDAQWRIAGDSIAAAFLEIGKRLGDPAKAVAEALAILKQPGSPFRNRQLDFLTLAIPGPRSDTPVIEEIFRLRGGCCRLYRLGGGALCPTCVLADPQWQRDELQRFMLEKSRAGQQED